MGCNNSTLDRLPTVALCRERCKFVGEALRESYALADAHATHMHSLTTLGPTLCRFFNHFQPQPNPTCYHSSPSPPRLRYEFGNYAPSPPPPPPPPTSTWDFFNVFENLDKYQVPCSPTQNQAQNKSNFDSHNHKEATEPTTHAMEEIQIMFQRASDSGNPISEILHVGRLRYLPNIAVNPVPCKMMHVFTPSKHLNCMESSRKYQGVHIDKGRSYDENLCSTLNKLCMWEKKLYVEVKDGEKLRVLHEKKCRQLKRMNKKDADAHKIDSLEALIGILATKIKISLQVVDKISSTIRKLMEEDLWPQINRLILRFSGMWKEMLECYKSQYKEISEAISVDASSFSSKPSNSHLDELIKLKSEVQNWNLSFSDWIYAQKAHVKALNGWLVRCLPYEPEELLDDGTPPFSPATIGAPPVFMICNKWSRAMDILSEKPVTEALNGFMLNVNELLEKHVSDLQQKLTLDKELEKKVKILEREERKMHKVVHARETMIPICRENNNVVHHGDLVDILGLQSGLKHVFDAMERFAASITRVYEVMCQQMEEE